MRPAAESAGAEVAADEAAEAADEAEVAREADEAEPDEAGADEAAAEVAGVEAAGALEATSASDEGAAASEVSDEAAGSSEAASDELRLVVKLGGETHEFMQLVSEPAWMVTGDEKAVVPVPSTIWMVLFVSPCHAGWCLGAECTVRGLTPRSGRGGRRSRCTRCPPSWATRRGRRPKPGHRG